jgi:hypothetical protein
MLKSEFKIVKLSEIIEQDWIPIVVDKDVTMYALEVPGYEGLEIESSVKDLIFEVSSETMFIKRTENKWEPFLLLLPDSLIPAKPYVMSSGLPLPTMSWFDVEREKWMMYVDPPRQASLLSMTIKPLSEYESVSPILFIPIILGFVLLFSVIYFKRIRI